MPSVQNSRLSELIEYACQTALMKDNPKSELESFGNFLQYEHDMKSLPGVQIDASPADGSEEIWFVVERLRESNAPKSDAALLQIWLDVSNDPTVPPTLKSFATVRELESAGLKLSTSEDQKLDPSHKIVFASFNLKEQVEKDFSVYLNNQWKPWSETERPRRRTINLYGKLFALKQQLEGGFADSQLELVCGIGMALWRMNDIGVRLPVITKAIELSLNEKNMAIEIRPRELDPRLELEIYSNADNAGVAQLRNAAREFFDGATETISPFVKSSFEPLLRSAITFLDSKGVYLPDDKTHNSSSALPKAENTLKITDSWVLFARPRGASLFVEDLERFQRTLKQPYQTAELPKAVAAIVTEPSNINEDSPLPAFRGISMVSGDNGGVNAGAYNKPQDLFFPKPFNDEQVRIVQLLEANDGVVVQGPPGTGKTHTIANIICHYLALGKRILVTSMREPALTVLREKLPVEIQPLAVSLLTSENDGMKQFQYAIEKIASIVQTVDKNELTTLIGQQEKEIDEYHFKIARCDRAIADWAQKNLEKFRIDDEFLEPREAADEIVKNFSEADWLEDAISIEPQFTPQFSNEDVQALREARRILGADMDYLGCVLPEIAAFPDVRDVLQTHQNLTRLAELEEQVEMGEIPYLADSSEQTFKFVQITVAKIDALKKLRQEISLETARWTTAMTQRIRRNKPDDIIELFEKIAAEIETAVKENKKYLSKPITLPDNFEQNLELIDAVQNLSEGNRPFGLIGMFGKSTEKKQLDAVKILGSAPANDSDWAFVLEFLDYRKRGKELIIRWNALAGELGFQILPVDISSLQATRNVFELYQKITQEIQLELILTREIKTILPAWNQTHLISEDETIILEAEKFLLLHLNKNKLAQTWVMKERFHNLISGCTGKITDDFRQFYENDFGNPDCTEPSIQNEWSRLLEELRRVHSLQTHLKTVEDITKFIQESGAPKWAEKLRRSFVTTTVDNLLPDDWQKIWRWTRIAVYLQSIDSRSELKTLIKQRSENENQLAKTYQDTIKNRTWLKLKQNTNNTVSAALEAYRTAVSKIGKGTGKRAVRYRRDARIAADLANPAIPCWIMPHYRISESLPSEFGCYDLVIIDEASQSDLTALPALLRAEKVLVVGDDKQVSPEGIGMLEDKIRKLTQQFLSTQVEIYKSQMTPERSIYDLFKVVFANAGVTLKEHFRCVAPIIEYSKREYYNHELIPLRLPKASERLDPPLIDVLVEDGVKLLDINKPEGEFIIDEIKRIIVDPQMKGRTIGVVGLLGASQTKYIYDRLVQEIGPEKMQEYELAKGCGDPRTFQGKERDIMFLTMVASKGDAYPLLRDTFAQRFNVAASRARDRMYLVRSVNIDDLRPTDKFRNSLIQHFLMPFAQDETRVLNLRELCESGFEREIYDILTERGYKVTPQVPVAGFRIDMVVEGESDARLAIECDGDRYHGPDKWESDMRRQKILERAGWRFWRCFASTFVMHRSEIIEDLLESLNERNIKPIGQNETAISRYVEHRRYTFIKNDEVETSNENESGESENANSIKLQSLQREMFG